MLACGRMNCFSILLMSSLVSERSCSVTAVEVGLLLFVVVVGLLVAEAAAVVEGDCVGF